MKARIPARPAMVSGWAVEWKRPTSTTESPAYAVPLNADAGFRVPSTTGTTVRNANAAQVTIISVRRSRRFFIDATQNKASNVPSKSLKVQAAENIGSGAHKMETAQRAPIAN